MAWIVDRIRAITLSWCSLSLPRSYCEVPQEYGVREYRYTVVNDRPVLVDPRTRRIVEVVE
jgi:hypothetical protein